MQREYAVCFWAEVAMVQLMYTIGHGFPEHRISIQCIDMVPTKDRNIFEVSSTGRQDLYE
jgi:hypothetical protein